MQPLLHLFDLAGPPRLAEAWFGGPYRRKIANQPLPGTDAIQLASWPAGALGPEDRSTEPSESRETDRSLNLHRPRRLPDAVLGLFAPQVESHDQIERIPGAGAAISVPFLWRVIRSGCKTYSRRRRPLPNAAASAC